MKMIFEHWFSLMLFISIAVISNVIDFKIGFIYCILFWFLNSLNTNFEIRNHITNERLKNLNQAYDKKILEFKEKEQALKKEQERLLKKLKTA
jgi:hypothetical protein